MNRIYSIFHGDEHEHNIIMSNKSKAYFHLFYLTKSWRYVGYPFMLVYEDQGGIMKVIRSVIIGKRIRDELSLDDVIQDPQDLIDRIDALSG